MLVSLNSKLLNKNSFNNSFQAKKTNKNPISQINKTGLAPKGISGVMFTSNIYNQSLADDLFLKYKNNLADIKILDVLRDENLTSQEISKLLYKITSNEDASFAFIDELLKDENGKWAPQKSSDIVKLLVKKIGGKAEFNKWYHAQNGYWQAFQKYGMNIYNNAKSIEELCAFMPNWGAWILPQKFDYIKNGNKYNIKIGQQNKPEPRKDSFTLGKLPQDFESKETYRNFIEKIREISCNNYRKLLNGTVVNGHTVRQFGTGLSGKLNLIVDNSYVIKIDKVYSPEYDNERIKAEPDSTYNNAMIDYYTSLYAPEYVSTPFVFYDDYSGSCIYKYIKGDKPIWHTDSEGLVIWEDLKKDFKDIEKIGITYTDLNPNNYIENYSGIRCVDSGHCVYFDILKPGLGAHTVSMPNRTGFNPLEYNGRLAQILDEN